MAAVNLLTSGFATPSGPLKQHVISYVLSLQIVPSFGQILLFLKTPVTFPPSVELSVPTAHQP